MRKGNSTLFSIVLMVLILITFRKQKIEYTKEGTKTELIVCISWYVLYFILVMTDNAFQTDIINEVTNWLFLFLFPLLIIAGFRKEKLTETLGEIGLKRMDRIMAKFPVYFCLMILTAGFTEEVFFRGIVQRCMLNTWKRPYMAILSASVLFGLYHFPFAFYLWDSTAEHCAFLKSCFGGAGCYWMRFGIDV